MLKRAACGVGIKEPPDFSVCGQGLKHTCDCGLFGHAGNGCVHGDGDKMVLSQESLNVHWLLIYH